MTGSLVAWYVARVAAMAAFTVLAAAVFTGMAIRTAYLAPVARNRAVKSLHEFLMWFWIPLIGVHVLALLLDATAQIRPIDVLIPFQVTYSPGATLAVGLGTVGFLLLLIVGISAGLRRWMPAPAWRWLHRLSYPMFVIFLLHAQLAGTDFSRTFISVLGWATLGCLLMLAVPRLIGGRMSAGDRTPDR